MDRRFRAFFFIVGWVLRTIYQNFLQEKAVETTKQREEKRKPQPKPEEQEGMPRH
jgi:hypothetical protein